MKKASQSNRPQSISSVFTFLESGLMSWALEYGVCDRVATKNGAHKALIHLSGPIGMLSDLFSHPSLHTASYSRQQPHLNSQSAANASHGSSLPWTQSHLDTQDSYGRVWLSYRTTSVSYSGPLHFGVVCCAIEMTRACPCVGSEILKRALSILKISLLCEAS